MKCTVFRFVLTAIVCGISRAGPAAADEADSRARCESLRSLDRPAYRVDAAEWVQAAAQTSAHCLFRVTIGARPSTIDGVALGTGVELRLPLEWNGRFLFQGGGGLNGVLGPAVGNVAGFPSALARGFAVVSTDSGHRGRSMVDSSFAVDQQAKLDFAYQAVQRTTIEAKTLIERFYERAPDYSYFMGCSTGGREAMMAAQRLPLEFDGIVAGNPTFNLTRIAANQVYSLQTITALAPTGADGEPELFNAFTDAELRGVADAVTAQCDALDGLADGMINDFQACGFDPASLRCAGAGGAAGANAGGGAGANAGGQCLSDRQVTALSDLFGGARNSRGESLYGAYNFDTGIASPAWRSMHLGSPGRAPANASLGSDTLRLFAMTPARPELDPLDFDFDRDLAATAETAAINDAVATLHTSYAGHGGKLIVYHGLSDQSMSSGALTDWYAGLEPRDAAAGPSDWARLYFVPGMLHCGGGQATDRFDMLTAIQAWVEAGEAPDRVVATGQAYPGIARPLCPYPRVARYVGGDQASAESFECR